MTHALGRMTANLRAVQSSALALYMATEVPGLEHDFARDVAEAEAEGSALIGAVLCPGWHGWEPMTPEPADVVVDLSNGRPCPACGAVV